VFTRTKVAVFVDGCFWHGCPEHGTLPKSNADWWATKLARNVERDADTDRLLADAGWTVIRVWEHEDPQDAGNRVRRAVLRPIDGPPGPSRNACGRSSRNSRT
jgi:DNA mismatch endonuclease (patch repair protein)